MPDDEASGAGETTHALLTLTRTLLGYRLNWLGLRSCAAAAMADGGATADWR
jgi:hypothetical protein